MRTAKTSIKGKFGCETGMANEEEPLLQRDAWSWCHGELVRMRHRHRQSCKEVNDTLLLLQTQLANAEAASFWRAWVACKEAALKALDITLVLELDTVAFEAMPLLLT